MEIEEKSRAPQDFGKPTKIRSSHGGGFRRCQDVDLRSCYFQNTIYHSYFVAARGGAVLEFRHLAGLPLPFAMTSDALNGKTVHLTCIKRSFERIYNRIFLIFICF